MSRKIRQDYKQRQFQSDEESLLPSNQSQTFISPVLRIHENQYTTCKTETTAVAKFILTGDIDKVNLAASNGSSLKKFLATSIGEETDNPAVALDKLEKCKEQKFMLIEAPPGMGKSFLLKEIAHKWSKKQLLKSYKIVLLITLGDPAIRKASKISDLLEPFCNKDTEAITTCSKYFKENSKDVAILIDGFDESPFALQKNNLIADILNHEYTLIIASRPHASLYLRKKATFIVDILGFPEQERMHFIRQALSENAEQLIEYLKNHDKISSLCSIPFYMSVLVYLYVQELSLPDGPYELYKCFINLTIRHHLVKHRYHPKNENVTIDLSNLPYPYNDIVKLLYKLSLESLNNNNKVVFSYDEIEAACPGITSLPEAINGLGLLQAVQHYGLTNKRLTLETTTYCFLHSSIPEFLGAYYISNISEYEELKVTFWRDVTFDSFKQFLTNFAMFNKILDNPLTRIHLFCSFYKAKNAEIYKAIDDTFNSEEIDLSRTKLSPINIELLAFFLTHSCHKTWLRIDLYGCYIHDHGLQLLHERLRNYNTDISIAKLSLSKNGLSKSCDHIISDIVIKFQVIMLGIRYNKGIGEDDQFYMMLTNPSSKLEKIDISCTNLPKKFFIALGKSKRLKELYITDNHLNNKAYKAMMKGIKRNSSLIKLAMYRNPISITHRQQIIEALRHKQHLHLIL